MGQTKLWHKQPPVSKTWSGTEEGPSTHQTDSQWLHRALQINPPVPKRTCMKKKFQRAKIDTYLIPYQMTQSTLIKGGQTRGCSSANTSRRHICLPHDAA